MSKKYILMGTLFSALLTGCVAAVVLGTAGLAVYDHRSVTSLEKDARIFHVLHTEIVKNHCFEGSRVVASSFNQVVLLTGQTPVASTRVMAEKMAKATPNVRRVYNEITIGYPLTIAEQSNDAWITSQLRTRMLAEKDLESGSIHVTTENAVVYLMGIVTPEQADIAVNVARHINGVCKVVKVFQYIR